MQRKPSPWNHNLSQHESPSCYEEIKNAAYPVMKQSKKGYNKRGSFLCLCNLCSLGVEGGGGQQGK